MAGNHAILSPSASERWLHCTPSARIEERIVDPGSAFAEEGTLAHALCAKRLKVCLDLPTDDEEKTIDRLSCLYRTAEMDEHVDDYRAAVIAKLNEARNITPDARLLVEQRLNLTAYIPECFGVADAIIVADGLLEVIDFKYGRGVEVSARKNTQMMIYALGAYELFSAEYDIDRVKMTIIQPRKSNVSEWETSMANLLKWANRDLKPKAQQAFGGLGQQSPGDWCRFCKAKNRCRVLATSSIAIVERYNDPQLLTNIDMARKVLPYLPMIKTWIAGMEDYALQQALGGVSYEGYKIVEGRSTRKITDTEAVAAALAGYGFNEADYMKPRELRSITDLEKAIGKKQFAELCGNYIDKPKGKPTLVREDDKRDTFNSAKEDFKDFIN